MRKIHLSIICGVFAFQLAAQSNLAATYSQEKYAACLEQCTDQLQENAQDSMALYYQGLCEIQLKNYQRALTSLRAAEAANFPGTATCQAHQARCLAGLGRPDDALNLLQTIVEAGFANYSIFRSPPLTELEKLETYQALRDTVHRRAYPCYYDPNYTHFDFWLGQWDVFVGDLKVGENTITKQEGGCAILEQYTTARNYVGQSLNFYDPSDGRWKQFWLDNTQSLTKYEESDRKPGYLQFVSSPESIPANTGTLRMTFTQQEDGSVRQLIEQQQADSNEWQVVFAGKYVKKS